LRCMGLSENDWKWGNTRSYSHFMGRVRGSDDWPMDLGVWSPSLSENGYTLKWYPLVI
jgi:hypothetical protein